MIIKCGECGASVSDQSFKCPVCGRDVRVLKNNGYGCRNCEQRWDEDCKSWGPDGYPCLAYSEADYD